MFYSGALNLSLFKHASFSTVIFILKWKKQEPVTAWKIYMN